MTKLPLNKNSNWYTVRFTDIKIFYSLGKVELYNYFTGEDIFIKDSKFLKKLDWYVPYVKGDKITTRTEKTMAGNVFTWINMRDRNPKYDTLENRK